MDDQSLIDKLKKLRKKEKTDWWNEISIDEQKSIEQGIHDAENGKLISHTNVEKHNNLYYRTLGNTIEIISLFSNQKNPNKKKI